MTATLGFERLPRPIATLLDEGAANLVTLANELDALVHGDVSSVDAIARIEDHGDRIVHDLIGTARDSWCIAPDRARLIVLAQAVDDVVDALDTIARYWASPPLPEFADLLLALRDAARDAGDALAAVEHEEELRARLSRCRQRERDVRRLSRVARAWVLVEQPDPRLAIRGHDLLRQADAALRACIRLHVRLECDALS